MIDRRNDKVKEGDTFISVFSYKSFTMYLQEETSNFKYCGRITKWQYFWKIYYCSTLKPIYIIIYLM